MEITLTHVLELPELEPLMALLRGAVAERHEAFQRDVLAQLASIARDLRTLQLQFSRELWNLQAREEAVAAARMAKAADELPDGADAPLNEPDTTPGATETSAGPAEAAGHSSQHQQEGAAADVSSPADVPQPAGEMAHEDAEHAPAPPCSPAPADLPTPSAPSATETQTWTQERRELLRALYGSNETYHDMLPRLNALPGRRITTKAAIKTQVRELGLARQGSAPPPIRTKGQAGIPHAGSWRTPERRAVLLRDWPLGVETPVIRARLEELPGPRMEGRNLASWAVELGVQRPKDFMRNIVTAQHAARRAQPTAFFPSTGRPAEHERPLDELSQLPAGSRTVAPVTPPPAPERCDGQVTVVRNTARPAVVITGSSGIAPRQPVRSGVPALPAHLVTRDGHFSSAQWDMRTEGRTAAMAPITIVDAMRWGANNKVEPLRQERPMQTVGRINNLRRSLGLPMFTIIPARSVADALPDPGFGGHFEGAAV